MKKFLCLLLTICLIFTLAACGPSDQLQDPDTDNPAAGDNSAGTETPGDADSTDTDQKDQTTDQPAAGDDGQKSDNTKQDEQTKNNGSAKPAGTDKADTGKTDTNKKPNTDTSKPAANKPAANKPAASKPSSDKNDSKANTPTSPLNLLNTVWKSYSDDEKFPAAGGDFSEENMKDGAPGNFSVSDSSVLASTLAVPEDSAELLKKAASLVHMMNLNTFTAGAFQLKDSKNADKFAEAMKSSIENRRWVCGFPDKFVIIKVDGYVVSAYGAADLIDTFKAKTLKAYKNASVYCEQNVE